MRTPITVTHVETGKSYDVVATDLDVVFYERDFHRSFDGTQAYTAMLYLAFSAGKRAGHWGKPKKAMESKKNISTDEFYEWCEHYEASATVQEQAVPLDPA